MSKNYKIFSGETAILITSKINPITEQSKITFQPSSIKEIKDIAEFIKKKPALRKIEILSENTKETFNQLKRQFNCISAAGGIVKNKKGEILFILKNDIWDLPKGKISKNEKKTEAALREVTEECGVKKLTIIKPCGNTCHIGKVGNSLFLKKTYWYEMFCYDEKNTMPQKEENITDVKWIDIRNNPDIFLKTYGSLVELLNNQ